MGEKLHSCKTCLLLTQSTNAVLPLAYDDHSHSCYSCDSWFTLPRLPGSQCQQPTNGPVQYQSRNGPSVHQIRNPSGCSALGSARLTGDERMGNNCPNAFSSPPRPTHGSVCFQAETTRHSNSCHTTILPAWTSSHPQSPDRKDGRA